MSSGEWREQSCVVSSVGECKKIYGLDDDPTIYEYEILEIEEDEEDEEYKIFDTLQEAEEYLENLAAEDDCWSYEIVEDNYEIPNGLLLIEYLDKDREHEDKHYLVGYKD